MTDIKSIINSTSFLTDGGLETDFIFNKKIDLPHFAAFTLVENPKYIDTLANYYKEYMDIAKRNNTGFILESPTWRANPDWAYKLGYSKNDLINVNKTAIKQLKKLKESYKNDINTIFISGQLGPRGDGYQIDNAMSIDEAANYHSLQINAFNDAGTDFITAITMTYINEALGITKSAMAAKIPAVISFTVETDGHLPSGESIEEAIAKIDKITDSYPLYYMINCAHPTHFIDKLENNAEWKSRIQGIRANASCKSHAELDESTELDTGDIIDLGQWHSKLKSQLPKLSVYGGCCGTDASHVNSICQHVIN